MTTELTKAAQQALDITIEGEGAKLLHAMTSPAIDGDDDHSPIRLLIGDGHSGHGLYVANAEYPEEGAELVVPIPKRALTQRPAAQTEREADGLPLIVAGAIFDFAGFMTTRAEVIEVGSTAEAGPVADLVKEWAELRGLDLADAAVLSWQLHITRATLPAPQQATPEPVGEPVYQLQSGDGKWIDQTRASYDYNVKHGNTVRVLCTRPAPGVPEGFALVPVEPTQEMIDALNSSVSLPNCYRAMLAAAQAKGATHD